MKRGYFGASNHHSLARSHHHLAWFPKRRQFCCISDDEIVDSAINIMIAGHDTTSTLSFLIKLLVNDPSVYGSIVQGMRLNSWKSLKFETAEQVSKDLLARDDLARMKICSNGVSKDGSSCVLFVQDDSQKDGRYDSSFFMFPSRFNLITNTTRYR